MSLLEEYGDRREKKAIKELILSLINSGATLSELSQKTGKSIPELKEILDC